MLCQFPKANSVCMPIFLPTPATTIMQQVLRKLVHSIQCRMLLIKHLEHHQWLRSPKVISQWNLALVLQVFLEESFEPVDFFCTEVSLLENSVSRTTCISQTCQLPVCPFVWVKSTAAWRCPGPLDLVGTKQVRQSSQIQPLLTGIFSSFGD